MFYPPTKDHPLPTFLRVVGGWCGERNRYQKQRMLHTEGEPLKSSAFHKLFKNGGGDGSLNLFFQRRRQTDALSRFGCRGYVVLLARYVPILHLRRCARPVDRFRKRTARRVISFLKLLWYAQIVLHYKIVCTGLRKSVINLIVTNIFAFLSYNSQQVLFCKFKIFSFISSKYCCFYRFICQCDCGPNSTPGPMVCGQA